MTCGVSQEETQKGKLSLALISNMLPASKKLQADNSKTWHKPEGYLSDLNLDLAWRV